MTQVLYARASMTSMTLAEAAESCCTILRRAENYALIYAPDRCHFARLNQEGELCGIHYDGRGEAYEAPLDLSNAFEARVFNKQAQLRWLHDAGQRRRAVLLAQAT